jgi:D-glycero-alpha-D-manno-heptose 1-phosphate guanylyltransferase
MLDVDLTQFSFEADVLQGKLSEINVHGMIFKDFFIDIGIPSDLSRANVELSIVR